MLKAVFKKKWIYGNPKVVKLQEGDWFRWVRFVNIVADDHGPNTQIFTEWDDQNNLYGYSRTLYDEKGEITRGVSIQSAEFMNTGIDMRGVEGAMIAAQAEDWRIETHQDLLPLARRVMAWVERQENIQIDKEQQIRKILGLV